MKEVQIRMNDTGSFHSALMASAHLDRCTCILCYKQISLQNSPNRNYEESYFIDKHSSHYPFKHDDISFLRRISLAGVKMLLLQAHHSTLTFTEIH